MISLNEPSIAFTFFLLFSSIFYSDYDRLKIANISTRFIHGLGCIYYTLPLIRKNNYQISMIGTTEDYEEYKFIINRSISYFLWDTFALLIEEEKEKMVFIAHHLLTIVGIYSGIVCPENTYNIALGLLIGEITNPLHQIMDISKVIRYRNIKLETFYLMSFVLARGGCGIYALMTLINNIYNTYNYSLVSNECTYSYTINIIVYILIIPLSFNWSHRKYRSINKYYANRTS